MEYESGERESNVLAAGNLTAAKERALRNATAKGARLVEGPTVTNRGSM
jgi:hypothetical protein